MKANTLFSVMALFVLSCCNCFAQDAIERTNSTLFDVLTDNSDKKKGLVVINQDERISDLVYRKKNIEASNHTMIAAQGYRVQVFSSNEQRTAKAKAYAIETSIKDRFPNLSVYVNYTSPFWKVRVGDCLSHQEAQYLREDIRKEFPDFQKETYIVRDQILVPEN